MANTYIRPVRIRTPGSTIDDTLTPTSHDSTAVDLLDTLGYVCSQIADITGETEWETAPDASIAGLYARTDLADKLALRRVDSLQSITVPNAQTYKILSVAGGEVPAGTVKAIASSQRGLVTAEATSFGSHGLDEVAGMTTLAPKNLLMVWDAATGDELESEGRRIYALLQHESGAGDGTAFTDTTPERAQVSFVRPDATYDDLEACPVADIQDKVINLSWVEREDLDAFVEQDFLQEITRVDLGVAGSTVTLDNAIDNQGATAATAATDIEIRLDDDTTWSFETSDGGVSLLDLSPASGGDTVTFNADDFDVNTTNAPDFSQGVKVDTAGTTINLGVTAGQIDAGANALKMYSSGAAVTIEGVGVNIESDTADFAVNTNDLFVDQSANRIGIQTASPQAPVHLDGLTTNTEAFRFDDNTGAPGIYVVDADPNGSVTGQKGSLALDYTNGKLHCNTDGATTWDDYSVGLFEGFAVAAQAAQGTDVAHGAGELSGDVDIRGTVNQININRESATLASFGLAETIEVEVVASRDNVSNTIDLDTGTNGMLASSDAEFQVDAAGAIDLNATGNVTVDGANISVDGTDTMNFTMNANDAAAKYVDLQANNAGAGAAHIRLNADDNVQIDATNFYANPTGTATIDCAVLSLDGTDTTNLTMTADDAGAKNLTVSAVNSGAGAGNLLLSADDQVDITCNDIDLNTTAGLTWDGTTFDINGSGAITVDGTTQTYTGTDAFNIDMNANDGSNKAIRLEATNAGAGEALIELNATDQIDLTTIAVDINASGAIAVDGATLSLDSTDTTNLTMTADDAGVKNLTVSAVNSGAGTGNLLLSADDEVDVTCTNLDIGVSGTTAIDTVAMSLDSTDTTNLTMTANDAGSKTMTIKAANSGAGTGNILFDADSMHLQANDKDVYVNTNDFYVDGSENRIGLQTNSPQVPLHMAGLTTNTEALRFDDGTDTVGIFPVDANPNGSITGTRGSIALDYTNGTMYINTDDSTAWSDIGTGSLSGLEIVAQAAQGTDVGTTTGTLEGDIDLKGTVNQINVNRDSETLATFGLAETIEVEVVASRDNTSNQIDLDTGTNGISLTSDENIDLTPTGDVDITVGSLVMLDTDASTDGVIYKSSDRFLHNFHHPTGDTAVPTGKNTFLGVSAGNFTVGSTATSTDHGSWNVGIGDNSLTALTVGWANVGVGQESLASCQDGDGNTGIGQQALYGTTAGHYNVGAGAWALKANISGDYNVGAGTWALRSITTGSDNIGIGKNAGRYITGGSDPNETTSSSIYIGSTSKASADGNANEIAIGHDITGKGTNTAHIGNDSVTAIYLPGTTYSEILASEANTSNQIDLDTGTNGMLFSSDAEFDVDATAGVTVDGTTLSLDGTDTTNLTMTANDAAHKALTIASSNAGAGQGQIIISADDEVNIACNNIDLNTTAGLTWDGTTFDINGSGALTMDAATFSIDSTDASNLTMTADDASDKLLTISASNAGAGDANIYFNADGKVQFDVPYFDANVTTFDIDATGTASIDAVAFSIDSTNASNLTMTADDAAQKDLTIAASNAGAGAGNLLLSADDQVDITCNDIDLNTTAGLTWDGTTFDINGSGAITVDGTTQTYTSTDAMQLVMNANDAGAKTLNIEANNAGAGTAIIELDADDEIELNTVLIDINASGDMDADITGNYTMDAATFSIDSTDTSNVTQTADDAADKTLTVSSTNAGAGAGHLQLTATDDVMFTTDEDTALPLTDGTSGSIASLFGGSHASVGAAIQAAGGLADVSVKVTTLASDYAQDVNVPGAIQDITDYPIDMETPADVEQFVFLNGILMVGGNGTTNNDVYAGDTPASGDVKFDHPDGVQTGDIIISIVIPKA